MSETRKPAGVQSTSCRWSVVGRITGGILREIAPVWITTSGDGISTHGAVVCVSDRQQCRLRSEAEHVPGHVAARTPEVRKRGIEQGVDGELCRTAAVGRDPKNMDAVGRTHTHGIDASALPVKVTKTSPTPTFA